MTKHRYMVTFGRRQSSKTLSAPVYARNALEARRKARAGLKKMVVKRIVRK